MTPDHKTPDHKTPDHKTPDHKTQDHKTQDHKTQDHELIYRVVISEEGRYSIWPEYKEIPWGWRAEGKLGPKQDCLDYIAEVWTDMRPLSLQKAMADQQSPQSSISQSVTQPVAQSSKHSSDE